MLQPLPTPLKGKLKGNKGRGCKFHMLLKSNELAALTQASLFCYISKDIMKIRMSSSNGFGNSTGETNMLSLAKSEPVLQFCALVFL